MAEGTRERLRGWFVVVGAALAGSVLAVVAAMHKRGLGTPGYATSPLIHVEAALLVLLGLVFLAQPVMAIVHAARRQWRGLVVVAATAAICVLSWVLAMVLDSPTLVYGT